MKRSEQTRTEVTRQRLLTVAAEEFAERGFSQSSASRIANGAGLTRGSLYYHFASKEALFEAVYVEQIKQLMEMLEQVINSAAQNPEEVDNLLINGFRKYFEYVERDTYRRICLIEAKSVLGVERVFELDGNLMLPQLMQGLEMMADAKLLGNIPPQIFGPLMIGIADQAALMLATAKTPQEKKALRAQLMDNITELFNGLKK